MICGDMPGIVWFANDNPYTECHQLFHYIILPDIKEEILTVKIWCGKYCYEKSEMLDERVFPLTQGGLDDAVAYIRDEDAKGYAFGLVK